MFNVVILSAAGTKNLVFRMEKYLLPKNEILRFAQNDENEVVIARKCLGY
jgi:hypothetical protein